ncbi:hypothetical protein [Alloscardovia omnicolens]
MAIPLDFLDVHDLIIKTIPRLRGWSFFDGEAAVTDNAMPPWVIVTITTTDRGESEQGDTALRQGILRLRVVGDTALSVNIACEKFRDVLDYATCGDVRIGRFLPDSDSGSYAGDLKNPQTNNVFHIRVLAWRFGWNAI